MRNSVLDSYAVLAFLLGERGHETILDLLEKTAAADEEAYIAAPNWAEVRYQIERKMGLKLWHETRTRLLGLPIEIVAADQHLAEQAGELKATRKMSLADCFCAALAMEKKADLYTGDPEFKAVEKEIKIIWL
ncbi:MAG: type II toxin-antitoxin system VapC family toxin [Candidatus Binatia bacterium]